MDINDVKSSDDRRSQPAAYVYRGANARDRLYECLIREGVDIDEILSRVQPNISLPARI